MVMDLPLTDADAVAGGLAGAFLGGACWAKSVVAAKSKPVQIKTCFMRCFSSGQSLFCFDPASRSCDRAKYCVRAPSFSAHFAEKGGSECRCRSAGSNGTAPT